MRQLARTIGALVLVTAAALGGAALAQQKGEQPTSYAPVDVRESFDSIVSRMKGAKAGVQKRQASLLAER